MTTQPTITSPDADTIDRLSHGFAKVFETFQVSALTLQVSDLVFDVLERRSLAKIRYRKDRCKDRLQTDIVALLGDKVHLQKTVIRFALDLDQIWDLR